MGWGGAGPEREKGSKGRGNRLLQPSILYITSLTIQSDALLSISKSGLMMKGSACGNEHKDSLNPNLGLPNAVPRAGPPMEPSTEWRVERRVSKPHEHTWPPASLPSSLSSVLHT